jgi:tetratricopeptide (TPR) repeat protein
MDLFAEQLATLRELKSRGFELELIDLDIADVVSWLGSGAERLGDLEAAENHFRESATILESLVEERPEDRRVPPQLANVLIHLSRILAVTGRTDEALRFSRQAAGAYARLHDLDPENAGWARRYYIARRSIAELAASRGNAEEAKSVFGELAEDDGTAEGRGEPIPRHAINSVLARAAIALDAGDVAAAADLADRALEGAEHALAEDPGDPNVVGSLATALILRGSAGRAAGDPDSGARDFQRAFEVLAPFAEDSRFWIILDPFARAAILLGRAGQAETTLRLLKSMGYAPLWPWPQPS